MNKLYEEQHFIDLASAIREKLDEEETYTIAEMAYKILDIPTASDLTSIHPGLFTGDISNLDELGLSDIPYIPAIAFRGNSHLTGVALNKCGYVGAAAFAECSNLYAAHLSNCATLGQGAFASCTNLHEVFIPKVRYIGYSAFYNCSNLFSIHLDAIPALPDSISVDVFSNTPLFNSVSGMYASIYIPARYITRLLQISGWSSIPSERFVGV